MKNSLAPSIRALHEFIGQSHDELSHEEDSNAGYAWENEA